MELELGLALPNHSPMAIKGLDLNCSYNNGLEIAKNKGHLDNYQNPNDHFVDKVQSKDLNLLLWSGQPNEEQDGAPEKWRNHHIKDQNMSDEEIIGWPPLNSYRKGLLHRHCGGWMAANHHETGGVLALRNSMYVKVKMEGFGIGRKIDLSLCNSYQALRNTLITMFEKYITSDYMAILYQDKEGDWMLVGDVPWESFVESVQRMKILRNEK